MARALDAEVAAARLRVSDDLLAEPALDTADTGPWLRRYLLVGIGVLAGGLVLTLLGLLWVRSEVNEPAYDVRTAKIPLPASSCASDPFTPPAFTVPGIHLPGTSTCSQTINFRSKNTFNKYSLYPVAFGVTFLASGVQIVGRSTKWRRVAKHAAWHSAQLVATKVERRQPMLAKIEIGRQPMTAVMGFRAANRGRVGSLGPGAVKLLTDGDGNWLMFVPHQQYPFVLFEARRLKQLRGWQHWAF